MVKMYCLKSIMYCLSMQYLKAKAEPSIFLNKVENFEFTPGI